MEKEIPNNIQKLVDKLRTAKEVKRLQDLEKILNFCGYECIKRNGGSHYIFRKKEKFNNISIPKHKPIIQPYIENVIEAFDEYIEILKRSK